MSGLECFRIYAIRYGRLEERTARDNFIGGDSHEGPCPIDYFLWAILGPRTIWIVDTGYSPEVAARRGRKMLHDPAAGLRAVGIDAAKVSDVIVTHLHYDHIGNFALFPSARFHLQDLEMSYATGRHMCHEPFRGAYEVDEVVAMVRQVYAGRVTFHDGDAELVPGLSLHRIGGHTMGLQVVRVWTQRGWVVLASDAAHFYANMEETRPFPIVFHIGDMVQGFRRLHELADSPRHIVPGHDPLVMVRYPSPSPELTGVAVRLDVDPSY